MPLLTPDGEVELPGLRVRSQGVAALVEAEPVVGAGLDRSAAADLEAELIDGGVPPEPAILLADVVAGQGARPVLRVPLDDLVVTGGPPGGDRSPAAAPAVQLTVDGPPEGQAQVLLETDATGVVAWHFASDVGRTSGFRSGLEQTFRVPVRQLDVPGAGAGDRGILGIGTRKVLQLLRYPLEQLSGAAIGAAVAAWERRARPYRLRLLDDAGLSAPAQAGSLVTHEQFAAVSGRPTLLLVHGTFSTAASAFAGLAGDAAYLAALRDRYEGRVLLFDHPSVSVDPVANARWLLERAPDDVDLVLDVVAHSRGGLVARALTGVGTFDTPGVRPPEVRRVVHVGVPNAGTLLADPQHWGALLDAATNVAMLLPEDAVSVPLTAVIETVKQVGTGVLDGLDGLAAMNPRGPWLPALRPTPGRRPPRNLSLASDFNGGSGALPVRALDRLMDRFFGESNDLVVPVAGAAAVPGMAPGDAVTLPSPSTVAHTGYFQQRAVRDQLARWLMSEA